MVKQFVKESEDSEESEDFVSWLKLKKACTPLSLFQPFNGGAFGSS